MRSRLRRPYQRTADPSALSGEIRAGHAVRVARRPFDQLDAVAIRVTHKTGLWTVLAGWALRLVEPDTLRSQVGQCCVERVDLHRDVAEAGADVDGIDLRVVRQLQGHLLAVAGQVEHDQDRPIP